MNIFQNNLQCRIITCAAMVLCYFASSEHRLLLAQPQTFPKGWSGGGKGYEISLDAQTKRTGKTGISIKFAGKEVEQSGFGTLTQGISADMYHGKRVRLTGYIKTAEADKASLWMRVDGKDPKGQSLAFDNMQNGREVKGTQEWRKCEVVLDVSDEAKAIFFGSLLSGKGQMWVDDLQLEVVSKDIPVTDLYIMSKEPKNLGFED